jgi:hypothetical protein
MECSLLTLLVAAAAYIHNRTNATFDRLNKQAIETSAIQNRETSMIRFDETSAILSIRAITRAEEQYISTYPVNGYSCSLESLGCEPSSGPPTASAAQLLENDLSSGVKSGYVFVIQTCTKATVDGRDRITDYWITAVPLTAGVPANVASAAAGLAPSRPTQLVASTSVGQSSPI